MMQRDGMPALLAGAESITHPRDVIAGTGAAFVAILETPRGIRVFTCTHVHLSADSAIECAERERDQR